MLNFPIQTVLLVTQMVEEEDFLFIGEFQLINEERMIE